MTAMRIGRTLALALALEDVWAPAARGSRAAVPKPTRACRRGIFTSVSFFECWNGLEDSWRTRASAANPKPLRGGHGNERRTRPRPADSPRATRTGERAPWLSWVGEPRTRSSPHRLSERRRPG